MDVSVIIPTRNRSMLLPLTLRSVLRQQSVDLEVIVVDEASTDDTAAVLASFRDPRIRVIRHPSAQGVSAARNRGIEASRADWIAFLDDDDLWAPEKLALQLEAARRTGAPWVYVGHVNINMRYKVTGGAPPLPPERLLQELPKHNVVPGGCSGVMVSKRGLGLAGHFDLRFQPLADWDLWLRLANAGVPAWVPEPLVAYRVHGAQMSLDTARVEAEFWMLAERNKDGNPAILLRYLGWWALRVKNYRAAVRLFVRAWRQKRPTNTLRILASDLAAVGRDLLEHKLRLRLPGSSSRHSLTAEQQAWRLRAQGWVDALIRESADYRT